MVFLVSGCMVEAGCVLVTSNVPFANRLLLAAAYGTLVLAASAGRPMAPRRYAGDLGLLLIGLILVTGISHQRLLAELRADVSWFAVCASGIIIVRSLRGIIASRLLGGLVPQQPVAFIGNSRSAARMLTQIRRDRRSAVQPIGFFDDRNSRPGPLTGLLPCLGNLDELVAYIHDHPLTEVYMALPWSASERMSQMLDRLRFLPLTVRLIPDHLPPVIHGLDDGQIEGIVMPTLMVPPLSAMGIVVKRGFDMLFSSLLLVLLLPFFLMLVLLVRLDSPGPALFRQVRSGQYGRRFRIYKFRTLHIRHEDQAADTLVTKGDRRVTRIGRILRKYSIDELPQIFNVLLGHMSLVGPRPHAPHAKADGRIYAEVIPEYMMRYRVKPGMTGWAQVNGWRGNTDTEEKLRKRVDFDFDYIGCCSLKRDLLILLRTVPSMLLPPPENS